MRCVELFSGCGGLALGLSRAGYETVCMVERDVHAVANVRHNIGRGIKYIKDWPIYQRDVRSVDWRPYQGVDLVAGGPPCQPFSVGGRHLGDEDHRDLWPEAVRAVREIEPKGFLFENVRGLAREAFTGYLTWVLTALAHPHVARREDETPEAHLKRLQNAGSPLYRVSMAQLNAADYGAAQRRHRVVIVGIHREVGEPPPVIKPTHSRVRLLWDQWVTEDYWKRHGIARPKNGPHKADGAIVRELDRSLNTPETLPWRTVRDALEGLGSPGTGSLPNHSPQPGARSYPGHTGSTLDHPSKALKAGVHGVPGGENTIFMPDGKIRYFTVREAARLQGMPDDFEFVGSWSENMRQLGNAVPTELAKTAALAITKVIRRAQPALKNLVA